MVNNAITQRLTKIGELINARLDAHNYKCQGITIKMSQWGDTIELQVFNDHEECTIKFNITEGYTVNNHVDNCEEITFS